MNNDMLVGGTTLVVPREQGIKVHHALCIGGLDTTEVGRIESALAVCADTTVLACAIAGPDIDQDICWLARIDIDELELEM